MSITSNYTGKAVKININSTPAEIAKFDFDEHVGCFVSLCGHFLLYMKTIPMDSNSSGKMHPFEPLITILEAFVFSNRKMTNRLAMDLHVPFALVHHAAMNSSVGKVRPEDAIDLSLTFSQSNHLKLKDFDEEEDLVTQTATAATAAAAAGSSIRK